MKNKQEQNLELKNAELERALAAKNRDLQIEAALECVRARAMAMQSSSELANLVTTLFSELTKLHITFTRCMIWLMDNDALSATVWMADPVADKAFSSRMQFPDLAYHNAFIKAWKERKQQWAYELKGREKKVLNDLIFSMPGTVNTPEEVKAAMIAAESVTLSFSFSDFGGLQVDGDGPLSEDNSDILSRFSKVFDQTYTRFSDLKKAEAQAREALIEGALERVRSRAMAMHKTDELREAAELLAKELTGLGIESITVCYVLVNEKDKTGAYYGVNPIDGKIPAQPTIMPHTETKVMRALRASWLKQEPVHFIALDPKASIAHQTYIGKLIASAFAAQGVAPEFTVEGFLSGSPERVHIHSLNFKQGYLFLVGGAPLAAADIDILIRFTKVFELTYTRFLDIQKAEAQAREGKIELALERVRARTMAMQHSDELAETAYILFQQFRELGENPDQATIGIINEAEGVIEYWVTIHGNQTNRVFKFPVDEPNVTHKIYKAWKAHEKSLVIDLGGKALHDFSKFRERMGGAGYNPDEKRRIINVAFFSKGLINVQSTVGRSLESLRLLERFANVFEGTYTRFLDLKKAEAQAREGQIELALERVRARAMAMRDPKELSGMVSTVLGELTKLDFALTRCAIVIADSESGGRMIWMANSEAGQPPISFYRKSLDHPYPNAANEEWKKRTPKWVYHLKGAEKKAMDHYYANSGEVAHMPSVIRQAMDMPESIILSHSFNNFGYLRADSLEPLSEANLDILYRFAKVFDLGYTRFTDIKQAEAQAREAHIELALERVRAKTMAMHNSEDVGATVAVMFDEMVNLGVDKTSRFGIGIIHPNKEMEVWTATANLNRDVVLNIGTIDMTAHPLMEGLFDCWNRKQDYHEAILVGEDVKTYYRAVNATSCYAVKFVIDSLPSKQYHKSFIFPEGALYTFSPEPLTQEVSRIATRFASVFGQTYRRYRDLQIAEAQARESQIQLALERVRARTMAMQKSDELAETVSLLFKQLLGLGIRTEQIRTCGIVTFNDNEPIGEQWITETNGGIIPQSFMVHYDEAPAYKAIYKAWKHGDQFMVIHLEGKKLKEHLGYLAKGTNVPTRDVVLPQQATEIFNHVMFFSQGCLFIITKEALPGYHDIFKRFGAVFQQSYTRFLDLKQAEAQARESQIQLALERVRARTMAMQKSDELQETSSLLFQQLKELGETAIQNSIAIVNEEAGFVELSTTIHGSHLLRRLNVPIDDPYLMAKAVAAWKAKRKSLTLEFEGQELKNYNELRNSFLETKIRFPEDRWVVNISFFSKGWLSFSSNKDVPGEIVAVQQRFAAVFEQTYTRFNDLKQAEQQAREALIESSLERVRSKTMAMHNSQDVGDTIATMFSEFVKLGIETIRCGILIGDSTNEMEIWTAKSNPDGAATLIIGRLDMMIHPLLWGLYRAWKNKESTFEYKMTGDDLKDYYRAINNSKYYPVQHDIDSLPAKQVFTDFFFADGAVFAFTDEPLADSAIQIFKRFAGVFGQTYRRYLDLRKAEAQAREAQIEVSLERVRSKAMAMHNSTDLSSAVSLVFTELKKLGVRPIRCGVGLFMKEAPRSLLYTAAISNDSDTLDLVGWVEMAGHPVLEKIYDSWLKQEDYFPVLNGKELKTYYKKLSHGLHIPSIPDGTSDEKQYGHFLPFPEGMLNAWAERLYSEPELKIIDRFKSIISLTFRQYLDLQKAEEAARESKIEASLERVRGRAMAMRNSGDLLAAASTVFTELQNLGVNPIRSGVGLLSKDNQKAKLYSNTSSATATHLSLMGEIDTSCHPLFEPQYQAWLKQQNYFVALGGKELATYYKILSGALNADLNISVKKSQKEYGHWFMFSEGFLYAWSDKEYTDAEMKVLERFKNVIELTFRRYIELQNSEAQARDAVRQASLDRVRAEIASMRTISDLDRITPLIWNELTILGVPFIRCGVFIMDEAQQLIHYYLSTPDGKAIAAFQLHFNSDTGNGVNQTALRGWREKQVVTLHWTEEEFKNFSHTLVEQGEIASEENYLTAHPPTGLDLHFFPFLQGMLYAGNTEPFSDDDKDLMQSLADAFSTAYARYEDFNRLELAKKEVERTLTDLKAAQTRLIQSEKMASLGELTAGIAHEIQNPLNFVNNFSEVNQDLLEELKAESLKPKAERDEQLEIELINDLINNEQKINHHGKRADGIVKGMLQHSRTAGGEKLPTNINSVAEEYMRLSYHGLRAKDKGFNAEMVMNFDPDLPKIPAVGQDIGRVMLNLFNNAFYAVNQKKKTAPAGYNPEVLVSTSTEDGQIIIKVKDNGAGMPAHVKEKIMQPFFTTKPTGEGTGLGLSLTYDMVVKGHGGKIEVNTKEGEFTEFIVYLPV